MNKQLGWLCALLAALLFHAHVLPPGARASAAQLKWSPPSPRLKEKTLFAPKPGSGHNIFQGDAERWLADVAISTESAAVVADKVLSDYVSAVGKNLVAYSAAPGKQYEFYVLDDEEANAMTAGGGRIYVNLGMLRKVESEDELAGVLAHEMGHDAFLHPAKTVTRQLFWMKGVRKVGTPAEVRTALEALFDEYRERPLAEIAESLAGFSRFDELEADRSAFYTTFRAGYNPQALVAVLKRMESDFKKESGKDYDKTQFINLLFGTHPPTSQRSMAFSWESNFVKMPGKNERHLNPSFDAMKQRLDRL